MKKHIFYNFILTGSNLLFPLITFPYLSRTLGANGLGICSFILSYVQNFTIIAALGIPIYGVREIAKAGSNLQRRTSLFYEILFIHLLFTGLILILYGISVYTFPEINQHKGIAGIGAMLILFNVFSIDWLFSGLSQFKFIALRNVSIRALATISIFVLVKNSDDYWLYFLIYVLMVFCTTVVGLFSAKNFLLSKINFSFKSAFSHRKPVTYLGIYMVFTSIYTVMPATILGFLSTKSAVGYYYGANRITAMAVSFFTAISTVLIPKANLVTEDNDSSEYHKLLGKSLNITISFGVPIVVFLFLIADPLIMILAGEDFSRSIYVLKTMAPTVLLIAFAQVFVNLILSVHRKDMQMVFLSVIGMILSVGINIISIPLYAEKAAGYAQLISEICVTAIAFFLAQRLTNFTFPLKNLLINILCVLPFAIIVHFSTMLSYNNIFIFVFSGLLCFVYFLFYQYVILRDRLIRSLVNSCLSVFQRGTPCPRGQVE